MKFPRWLVGVLLVSSLAVTFSALAWWWVVWPERTEREFLRLVADGKFDEANQMMQPSTRWSSEGDSLVLGRSGTNLFRLTAKEWRTWFQEPRLERHSPSVRDYVTGSRRFSVVDRSFEFTAEKGKLRVSVDSDQLARFLARVDLEKLIAEAHRISLEAQRDLDFERYRDRMRHRELPAMLFLDERKNAPRQDR